MGRDYQRVAEVGRVQESRERRANNRQDTADVLRTNGVKFESKNHGAHLVIEHAGLVADLWPGTGLFSIRGRKPNGRGVFELLKRLGIKDPKRPDRVLQ